jgi:periplasmic divalent cation tolerance protein
MQSVFRWEGEVQTAAEYLLLAKTTTDRFPPLAAALNELHSYDLPEIIAVPVTAGSENFLAWIAQSV